MRPPFRIKSTGEKGGALKIREAIELFAIAKELDASAFVAAVCREPRWSTASSEPFGPLERLRVKLELEINPQTKDTIAGLDFVKSFLGIQSIFNPGDDFVQAKQQLLELCGTVQRGDSVPQFDVELDLRLLYSLGGFKKLPQITEMIGKIDRAVFNVSKLSVTIGAANFGTEKLTEFSKAVHSFRGSADVEMLP